MPSSRRDHDRVAVWLKYGRRETGVTAYLEQIGKRVNRVLESVAPSANLSIGAHRAQANDCD